MDGKRRGKQLGQGRSSGRSLARILGWLSIGLGVAEVAAARQIARSLGMAGQEGLIRLYGAREVGSGVLLITGSPRTGATTRVVGDVLDLIALLPATRASNPRRAGAMVATAMVAGIAALDLFALSRASHQRG